MQGAMQKNFRIVAVLNFHNKHWKYYYTDGETKRSWHWVTWAKSHGQWQVELVSKWFNSRTQAPDHGATLPPQYISSVMTVCFPSCHFPSSLGPRTWGGASAYSCLLEGLPPLWNLPHGLWLAGLPPPLGKHQWKQALYLHPAHGLYPELFY